MSQIISIGANCIRAFYGSGFTDDGAPSAAMLGGESPTLFDKYMPDMTRDSAAAALDRRLAVTIGAMLDTGERR
jgi:hypothetical protein